jgi:hypothetical protein
MRDIIIKCGIRDGEKVEGEIEEGGCEETFLVKPNLKKM